MAIRDLTYYGWKTIKDIVTPPYLPAAVEGYNRQDRPACFFSDVSGNFYIGGACLDTGRAYYAWVIYRSANQGRDWTLVDFLETTGSGIPYCVGMMQDISGNLYACGEVGQTPGNTTLSGIIRKSSTGLSGTWQTIEDTRTYTTGASGIYGIAQDTRTGKIYAVGHSFSGSNDSALVRVSSTGLSGSFSTVFASGAAPGLTNAFYAVAAHSSTIYTVGRLQQSGGNTRAIIFSSSGGASGTWGLVDEDQAVSNQAAVNIGIKINNAGTIYVLGRQRTGSSGLDEAYIKSSTTGVTGSWQYFDHFRQNAYEAPRDGASILQIGDSFSYYYGNPLAIEPTSQAVYYCGNIRFTGTPTRAFVRCSMTGLSASFVLIDCAHERPNGAVDPSTQLGAMNQWLILANPGHEIYTIGGRTDNMVLRYGKRSVNSASLGPAMLATSFGYVQSEVPLVAGVVNTASNGATLEKYDLNNVSEFPHSAGIFQMKNLFLGTVSSGKIGKNSDSLIQVTHIGSTVKVMWPKQDVTDKFVKGFGDFSAGERVGKLTTAFQPGDSLNVTEFDHMTLYGYVSKQESGSIDNIVITIERKPLPDLAFAREQAVEYQSSGTFTVANLTDIVYKKQIDYGDLSLREIGFPIDVPLTNVKEIRVSVKHDNGQSEANKNFILWGRFIKSSKDTNET